MDSIMYGLLAVFLPALAVVAVMGWRNPVMLKLGLRNIPRRRAQTILIIVGIMISTLIMAAAFGTGDTITFSIRKASIDALGTIDEIILSARAGAGDQLGTATYLPMERFDRLREELADIDEIDGLAPGIGEIAPTFNPRTSLSEGRMRIAGVAPEYLDGFGGFFLLNGDEVRVEDLGPGEAFINENAAEELEVVPGDEVVSIISGEQVFFRVKGVVGGGGLAGDDANLLVRLDRAQEIFGREGSINSIVVSNRGDEYSGVDLNDEVTTTLRVLFTDREVAADLKSLLARDDVLQDLEGRQLSAPEGLREDIQLLVRELREPGLSDEFISVLADEEVREEIFSAVEATGDTEFARQFFTSFEDLAEFRVIEIKRQILDLADGVGSAVTGFFIVMGLFSIMVGVLLIFLIFVMLAAARRSEMGMARAIGAKRSHLVQMFVFEGTAYSILAGAVGVGLGLVASIAIVSIANRIFAGGGEEDFQLTRHFEVRSAVVAYCLGMVITFLTVGISAFRVSRLNIVAAVRGLPPPPDTSQPALRGQLMEPVRVLLRPGRFIGQSVVALVSLHPGRALSLLLQSGWAAVTVPAGLAAAVTQLLWGPFSQGWLAVVAGVLLTWAGMAGDSAAPMRIGMSLVIVGVGLMVRWLMRRAGARPDFADRVGYTLLGVVGVVFWAIPFNWLQAVFGELQGGIEMFFVSGVAMVAAAVWAVMYNADLLLRGLTALTGRFGRLRPVLVTAVAYPMSAKFRTGLTLAMFALVIFTLIVMSILTEAFGAVGDAETAAGGWDIHANVNINSPIDDINDSIAADPGLDPADFEAIGGYTYIPVQARQLEGEEQGWRGYAVRAADEEFLANNDVDFKLIADGYGETPDDVWEAMRQDPTLVAVDSFVVPTSGGFREERFGFQLEGLFYEDESMTAIDIEVREPRTGGIVSLKVIGVLDAATDLFGELGNGMLASKSGLDDAVGFDVPVTNYRFKLTESADPAAVSGDLDAAFRDNGMESRVLQELVDETASANRAFNYLFTGFMGLGLLVGVAALGVVSLRAVVERRQQIGVLRAIGYRRGMVQLGFLIESSFVVLLGVAIGVGLGTIISYNIVNEIREDLETVRFAIPWVQILIIIGIAYVFSLITTFLPARQASRIYPAEALRYE